MAAVTTYDVNKTIPEDIADVIENVSPDETPVLTMLYGQKWGFNSTSPEWLTDELGTASENAKVEAADAVDNTVEDQVILSNYTQISDKTIKTSGTQGAINHIGKSKQHKYELVKKGKELKLDIEYMILGNRAKGVGSKSKARTAAGIQAYLTTNTNGGSGGADPTSNSAGWPEGTAKRTAGTKRDLTEDMVKEMMQTIWLNGGRPDYAVMNASQKARFDGFTGNATKNREQAERKLVTAIDIYVTSFGTIKAVPCLQADPSCILFLEMDKLGYGTLPGRNMKKTPLAKTGDAERDQLLTEWSIKVSNERAHGIIADLNG